MRPLYIEVALWKPAENVKTPEWEGHRNFWVCTDSPDGTHLRHTAGINPVSKLRRRGRRPAVAIFLTPAGEKHRLPWLDEVDADVGFIRYFGDNKPELRKRAEESLGNRVLLEEMNLYASDSIEGRRRAAPLLFFMNRGSAKGKALTEFLGFGLIREAHRVTQLFKGRSFANYAFDCILFRGSEDDDGREALDFEWIDSRRNAGVSDVEAAEAAPASWKRWVSEGAAVVDSPKVRRYVLRHDSLKYEDQVPDKSSRLGKVLEEVYKRFDGNYKHGFQALAAVATKLVLAEGGLPFHDGWITPVGPDGGVDFVQRLDLGRGFSSTKLVVLGQAKCRKPWPQSGNGVNAEDLARVVARLRRGWIGAYVTTSFFTEMAQQELVADEYPIVLIPGMRVAQAVEEVRTTLGLTTVKEVLDWSDKAYVRLLSAARAKPADITREWPSETTMSVITDESRESRGSL